jgi:hypothetical protein
MVFVQASGRRAALSGEQHEEWLLDDAIDHTFPASDPASTSQPGSIVSVRYAALEGAWAPKPARAPNAIARWLLPGALVACAVLLIRHQRRKALPRLETW